jgi:hypothetical protein
MIGDLIVALSSQASFSVTGNQHLAFWAAPGVTKWVPAFPGSLTGCAEIYTKSTIAISDLPELRYNFLVSPAHYIARPEVLWVMKLLRLAAVCLVFPTALVSSAQNSGGNNGYEIVRIPTATNSKCIDSKTDEISLGVYRLIVEKQGGFLTSDNAAGVAVIATLNGNSIQVNPPPGTNPTPQNVQASTPQVQELKIAGEQNGQVFIPLEYPIASRFVLSQSNGVTKAETTSMQLSIYLEKTRGANTFGTIVDDASSIIGSLPIPASPYLSAADTFLTFATKAIQDDANNSNNANLIATVNIPFADTPISDLQTCEDQQDSYTGAIAVIAATGNSGSHFLTLGNLDQRYCWRFSSDNTFEVQYADKPSGGCTTVQDSQFNEPSNDYTMLTLTAETVPSSTPHNATNVESATRRTQELSNSKKICDSLRVSSELCGQ